MENRLQKKYGLVTAICLVIGIVIGSGVFFKAQAILQKTNGDMPLGIIAWIIGGIVMLVCMLNFSTLATRYEKVNGIVDYAEATVGERYAYYIGWFSTMIYYPGMTSVLAWVSARYTLEVFGVADAASGICLSLACLYLCASYAVNVLSPKLAGKVQVSATVIKLIPLILMAVAGTIYGIVSGNTAEAFKTTQAAAGTAKSSLLFAATVSTAFAYEGWIIATSINSELKNAKRNLPLALVFGGICIALIYILYYIGLAGAAPVNELMEHGSVVAFNNLLGGVGGTVMGVFVAVSCLGTLNGLMLAATRGLYSLAVRGHGPKPGVFSEISKTTDMPANSSVVGLLVCAAWLFYFYGANLMQSPIFGLFSFDSSELPIVTIYAFYIPVFVMFIMRHGRENKFKNTVMPILAIICSAFMCFAAIWAHGVEPYLQAKAEGRFSCPILFYLIVFAVIMFAGAVLYHKNTAKKGI